MRHGPVDVRCTDSAGDPTAKAGEMLRAQREWLPQFAGKSLKPVGNIATPSGTVGVAVPLDPALAINNRFGKLASARSGG